LRFHDIDVLSKILWPGILQIDLAYTFPKFTLCYGISKCGLSMVFIHLSITSKIRSKGFTAITIIKLHFEQFPKMYNGSGGYKMKNSCMTAIAALLVLAASSCGNQGNPKVSDEPETRIMQQEDGTVSLKLAEAALYNDPTDPAGNTAEWEVVITKPGRYKVWLTSATKDTMDLRYSQAVKISLMDDQLEGKPVCDRISENAGIIHDSYFIAESYMGSFFIADSGEYKVQVISEKVDPKKIGKQNSSPLDDTMMISVQLTPATR
jgi:hypothetical protein